MDTQVLELLGGSIAYEENKGDFAAARRLAEQQVAETADGDPSVAANALADRALVRLLQGEPLAALEDVARILAIAPTNPNVQLRARTCMWWAAFYERFNTFPDGGGASATEIEAREHGLTDLQSQGEQWREASDPSVKREAKWIGLLNRLRQARKTFNHSSYYEQSGHPIQKEMLENVVPELEQVRQDAAAGGFFSIVGVADWYLADLYRHAAQPDEARNLLVRASQGYEKAGDAAGMADCLMAEADWACAPFSSPLVWNLALQDSSNQASDLPGTLEADEFRMPSRDAVAKANQRYDEAYRLFKQAGALRGVAAVRLRRGYLAMLGDDFTAATDAAVAACEAFIHCGDARAAGLARTHHVLALVGAGHWTQAPQLARDIGRWGECSGSFSTALGLGILMNRWARHWLIRRGDYERALAGYRCARALFDALGARVNAAQSLVDQGVVYQAVGERGAALVLYEQALDDYAAALEQRPRIASALRQRLMMLTNNVFQLYLERTDGEGMERSAQRLERQVAELLPVEVGGENLLSVLGNLVMAGRDAGATMRNLDREWVQTWSLRQLAESHIRTSSVLAPLYCSRRVRADGDDATADVLLKQAEVVLGDVGEDQRNFLAASVLAEAKRYEEAAAAVRAHLAGGGANAGFSGTLMQVMRALRGPSSEAEARLQQRRTHEQAFSMFVRVKAYAEAKTHLEALEQFDGPRWWESDSRPWQPLSDCGETYEGLGDYARALEYYDMAILALETRRGQLGRDELKSALVGDKGAQYLYLFAARTATKLGASERAFGYCERGKARALLDLMAGTAVALKENPEEGSEMRRWRELSARLQLKRGLLAQTRSRPQPDAERITQLADEIAVDEAELTQIEAQLAQVQPEFLRVVSREASTLSLEQVATALPHGAVLLEYFFVGEDFLCWAVDRQGLRQSFAETADMRALTRDIRAFNQTCATRAPIDALAEQLAQRFLNPLADAIRDAQRLIVVPYGAAHKLPFHALPFDGKPLAAERAVSYLPSASTLQFLALDRAWPMPESLLAVGNPTGDLPDLPSAEAEAAYVASLFGTQALIGKEATEAAVRARIPTARLLHFATHGEVSEEAPLSSWIALADNERLTLYELMGLRMDADLVVLSACETGQGQTTGGDDVVGLTRGLLGAGARAAIVSLWPVDDVATSLLMGEFYYRLTSGDTPSIALRKAQNYLRFLTQAQIDAELAKLRAALKQARSDRAAQRIDQARSERFGKLGSGAAEPDYSHPYYWAPFVMVG